MHEKHRHCKGIWTTLKKFPREERRKSAARTGRTRKQEDIQCLLSSSFPLDDYQLCSQFFHHFEHSMIASSKARISPTFHVFLLFLCVLCSTRKRFTFLRRRQRNYLNHLMNDDELQWLGTHTNWSDKHNKAGKAPLNYISFSHAIYTANSKQVLIVFNCMANRSTEQ